MKLSKHIKLTFFTNYKKQDMFGVTFVVPPDSADDYRGWNIKKAEKVAKMFRNLAKRLESL